MFHHWIILDNITKDESNEYSSLYNTNWNLKEVLIKYCENDVISLWKIISYFKNNIFKNFTLNALTYPTLFLLGIRYL